MVDISARCDYRRVPSGDLPTYENMGLLNQIPATKIGIISAYQTWCLDYVPLSSMIFPAVNLQSTGDYPAMCRLQYVIGDILEISGTGADIQHGNIW